MRTPEQRPTDAVVSQAAQATNNWPYENSHEASAVIDLARYFAWIITYEGPPEIMEEKQEEACRIAAAFLEQAKP